MHTLLVLVPMLAIVPAHADETNNKKSALCALGDIDKDGVPDLALASRDVQNHDIDDLTGVVGSPGYRVPERVWLISGKDGSLIHSLPGDRDGDGFGSSLASAGDLDEDGIDDLVVGCVPAETMSPFRRWTPSKSCVRVYSGASGAQLFVVTAGSHAEALGTSVAGLGDLDGDGIPEFAASAPFGAPIHASGDGRSVDRRPGFVRVYSGLDASLLYQVEGRRTGLCFGEAFGTCISSVGDLDEDGRPDFAVSAPGRNLVSVTARNPPPGQEDWEAEVVRVSQEAGSVLVYSGRFGRLIGSIDRTTPGGAHGWTIAPAGDVDADGKPDLLVGSLHSNVDVVSGATLRVIHHRTWEHYPIGNPNGYATSIASIGDVDGDGASDIVIGSNDEAWFPDPGDVTVISGRSGIQLWRYFRPAPQPSTARNATALLPAEEGYDACGCGDVNGDGTPDVAVVTQFSRELLFLSGKDRVLIRAVQIRDLEK